MSPEGMPLTYMLYGHVHNTHDERLVNEFIRITKETMVTSRNQTQERPIPCNMINCFCMFSDYIPLTLDDWIRIDAGRRAKLDRQSNPTNNTGFQQQSDAAFYTTGRMTDTVKCGILYIRNLRKERLKDMRIMNVLSSSFNLYLSLLHSSKVLLSCGNAPIKQRHS